MKRPAPKNSTTVRLTQETSLSLLDNEPLNNLNLHMPSLPKATDNKVAEEALEEVLEGANVVEEVETTVVIVVDIRSRQEAFTKVLSVTSVTNMDTPAQSAATALNKNERNKQKHRPHQRLASCLQSVSRPEDHLIGTLIQERQDT